MMLINSSLGGMKTKTTMVIFVMSCLLAVQAQPNNGQSHVNDFFHCENPKNIDKKTQIKCDKNTFEWALDELDPEGPPEICGEDYVVSGQPASMPGPGEVEDALEPCLLWSIFYGSLSTGTPTIAPTTIESTSPTGPTDPPTTEDGEDGGLLNPTASFPPADGTVTSAPVMPVTKAPVAPTEPPTDAPSASPTENDPFILRIDAFTLTLTWPSTVELNIFNGPDRLELYDITLQHLETSLRAELNGVPIDKIELNMQTALTSPRLTSPANAGGRTWTELVSGFVQFGIPAPIEKSTLQALVMDTFSGNAMDVYEFRLQLANDEVLKMISRVSMGLDGNEVSTDEPIKGAGAGAGDDGGLTWSPLFIAIVVCVVVGVCMACVFAYFLLYGRKSRRSRQAKAQEEYKSREIPELQTDPTPPSDGEGLEYSAEDYHQHKLERYPSALPTPDGITVDSDQNLHQPYVLNPVESDAGSSLRNDGDTFYDMENQSLAPSLYSYRDEASLAQEANGPSWNAQKQQQAPPQSKYPDSLPKEASPPRNTAASDKGSPPKKPTGSSTAAGALLGGIVGKYMGNNKKNKSQPAPGAEDHSSSEDEYGFEKEANPNVEDASILRVDTVTSNQSVAENSISPSVEDGSLISDGRVGQILGDVHSIQGQESPQNFDDIWNDDDSEGEDHRSNKSTITDPDGTEKDVIEVLNVSFGSKGSKPFDELADAKADRPFDEQRIEQRDIVIPDIPIRSGALVNSQQETERWSNSGNSQRNDQILPPLEDDEVSQLGEDDLLLPDPVKPTHVVTPEKAQAPAEEESVEDYDHHHKMAQDDSTHDGSSTMIEERSIAEDSYGFVPQKHYMKQSMPPSKPKGPPKKTDEDVKLALPQNLKQRGQVVDSVPGNEVVLASSGSGEDQSIEAVSVGSSTSPSKKAGLSSNIKSLASKPRQLVKGMSVRKKKNSDWGSISQPTDPVPRPTSPTPSVESTDSAKFRELMNEPDVFDTPVGTPEDATPKEAVEDTKRKTPAPLLQRMPSDSDDDDCYLEDDKPVIPYPAGVLPRTAYEEKKDDDSSVVFSLDEVTSDV